MSNASAGNASEMPPFRPDHPRLPYLARMSPGRAGPGRLLGWIIVLGMALQIVTLFLVLDPAQLVWIDPIHIYQMALDLANGLPFSTEDTESNLERAPGYPYFLALLIKLTGSDLVGVRALHILFCPLFLLVIYRLGAAWRNPETGLLAALLSAVYPFYVYVPLTLYPEGVLIAIFLLLCAAMHGIRERATYWRVFAMALLLTGATMIRPTSVIWIPVIVYFFWDSRSLSLTRVAKFSLILIVVPMLAVSAWMIRNKETHDALIFTTTDQRNLIMSYNENAAWDSKTPQLPGDIERRLDAAASLAETREIAFDEALHFIARHPGRAAGMFVMRCLGLWSPIPVTEEYPQITRLAVSDFLLRLIPGIVFSAYVLLAIGGAFHLRRDPLLRALLLLLLMNTAVNGLFLVSVRFRIVTDFAVILAAAAYLQMMLARKTTPRELAEPKLETAKV